MIQKITYSSDSIVWLKRTFKGSPLLYLVILNSTFVVFVIIGCILDGKKALVFKPTYKDADSDKVEVDHHAIPDASFTSV